MKKTDEMFFTSVGPRENKDGQSFAVSCTSNGVKPIGIIAGRISPSSGICFIENLQISDPSYQTGETAAALVQQAINITGMNSVTPVDLWEDEEKWWAYIRSSGSFSVGETISSKQMLDSYASMT